MKKITVFIAVLFLACVAVPSFAAEDPVKKVVEDALGTFVQGCEKELTTYCKDVTPGDGRLLACIYAYQDKLSPRCEYALYDSAAQLERALSALTYAANECRDDLKTYCADIQPGEGRLRDCLGKNEAKLNDRCKAALKDVGLK
jgi:hypothetical protein